jgi:epoxyqueuosine reductase
MAYLARPDAIARRADLSATLADVKSVVVVTQGYFPENGHDPPRGPSRGIVARYARGRDYHEVVSERLHQLLRWLQAEAPGQVRGRIYVDTGPLLERELGTRTGLGWLGKNTMLIHPDRGSYFFLGVLLLDLELQPDAPFEADHCGSCRRCLDACPTGALRGYDDRGAPVMDARLCISYLTIELKGAIPPDLRPRLGNRIFGCDICQEVCPWNERFAGPTSEAAYLSTTPVDGSSLITLAERLLSMTAKGFQREFAASPLSRAGRRGLLRNVCVALGNWGSERAVAVLVRALSDHQPLVRGHAAWSLGRIGSERGRVALEAAAATESDAWVTREIGQALGR